MDIVESWREQERRKCLTADSLHRRASRRTPSFLSSVKKWFATRPIKSFTVVIKGNALSRCSYFQRRNGIASGLKRAIMARGKGTKKTGEREGVKELQEEKERERERERERKK